MGTFPWFFNNNKNGTYPYCTYCTVEVLQTTCKCLKFEKVQNRPTLLHSFRAPLPLLHCLQSMNSHSIIYQTFSVGHLLILGLDSRKGPFFTLWTSNQKMLVQPSEIFMHSDIYKDDAFQLFVAKLNPNHPPVSYCTSIFLRLTLLHAARNFLK